MAVEPSDPSMSPVARAIAAHRASWGEPTVVARAPGRVNLIGEHTDYNDGFVLPIALGLDTAVALSATPHGAASEVTSEGFGTVSLGATQSVPTWARHLLGLHQLLQGRAEPTPDWRAAIASDVPAGAGLGSSAALEIAVLTAVFCLTGEQIAATDVARLGQRVENDFLGLPSGIMDQLIAVVAAPGRAALIDCRTLSQVHEPMPADASVVALDTGGRRRLTGSAFADRRAACERAARALGVDTLREARIDAVDALPDELSIERRRARHVVTENRRTIEASTALRDADTERLGRLMTASHRSLADDFEVSSDHLDTMVDLAVGRRDCHGARLTGGGFAGHVIALVDNRSIEEFSADVTRRYHEETGLQARAFVCRASGGASAERLTG